jgi:uncharacterized protein YndB with AHSA1/START domain
VWQAITDPAFSRRYMGHAMPELTAAGLSKETQWSRLAAGRSDDLDTA